MESVGAATFGEALGRLSRSAFVGREEALAVLETALLEASAEPRIVTCVGLAGVGKTTLVQHFVEAAARRGHRSFWIEGERLAPNVQAFERELRRECDWRGLGHGERADILVIDAFEKLSRLENWLFSEALPQAGASLLVLLTSREPLRVRTTVRPGLRDIHRELRLDAFDFAEAQAYLHRSRVPEGLHRRIIEFTQGHPLALALVAMRFASDPTHELTADLEADVMRTMLEEFLREIGPGPRRDALYALSLPRATDSELLSGMLGYPSEELYHWAEQLPFVQRSRGGIFPHGLVRSILHYTAQDLPRFNDFASRGLEVILQRARGAPIDVQRELLLEMLYVGRHRSQGSAPFPLEGARSTSLMVGGPQHVEPCARILRRVLGPESEALFRYWMRRQPDRLHVAVDEKDEPAAFSLSLRLSELTDADLRRDPVVAAAHAAWQQGFQGGGPTACFRFFLSRGGHRPDSPLIESIVCSVPFATGTASPPMTTLVFAMPCPDLWEPLTALFPLERIPSTLADVDGLPHGVFIGDLSAGLSAGMSPDEATLATMRMLALAILGQGAPMPSAPACPLPISHLRDALRDLYRPHQLAGNPWVALPPFSGSTEAFVERVRALIGEMADNPAYADSAAVLHATYIEPAVKQQAAAVQLGLAYGTYRHRLRKAIAELSSLLRSG